MIDERKTKAEMNVLYDAFEKAARPVVAGKDTELASAMIMCAAAALIDLVALERGTDRAAALATGLAAIIAAGPPPARYMHGDASQ